MRISSSQIFNAGVSSMLEQQGKLLETQTQLASGKRYLTPADDPVAAVRSLELNRALERGLQYQRNSDILDSRLRLEESALAEGVDIVQRIRELALQANNAIQSNESRQLIARQVELELDALMAVANRRDSSGNYIFSGYQQDSQAFVRTAGTVVYNGDDGQRFLQVGANQQLADTAPGSKVFAGIRNGNGFFSSSAATSNAGDGFIDAGSLSDAGSFNGAAVDIVFASATEYELRDGAGVLLGTGDYRAGDDIVVAGMTVRIDGQPAAGDQFSLRASQAEDAFSMVSALANSLAQPRADASARAQQTSEINTALTNLDRVLDRFIARQADSGARLQALDRQRDVNSGAELRIRESLGVINDLDYAEAVSRFEQQRIGLQAAQQAFAKVQGLSLFNYL